VACEKGLKLIAFLYINYSTQGALVLLKMVMCSKQTRLIVNINDIQSNATQLLILLRCISYIVSFNDLFRL